MDHVYTRRNLLVHVQKEWKDEERIHKILEEFFQERFDKASEKEKWTIVHTGSAEVKKYTANHQQIKAREYSADWTKLGVAAGLVRNLKMVEKTKPDAAIVFYIPSRPCKTTTDCLRRLHEYSRLKSGSRLWSIKLVY